MEPNAIRIDPRDNVAVATRPIRAGESVVAGGARLVDAAEEIPAGHKVALEEIGPNRPIRKYGHTIGLASEPIRAGSLVHTQNLKGEEG